MKSFFEEYGRTIVTVLIILGIILVGYTIAGNGKTSAFGRFTSDVVDSLSSQANHTIDIFPKPVKPLKSYTGVVHKDNTGNNVDYSYIFMSRDFPDYYKYARFDLIDNDVKIETPVDKNFKVVFEAKTSTPARIYIDDIGFQESSYPARVYSYVDSSQWKTYSIEVTMPTRFAGKIFKYVTFYSSNNYYSDSEDYLRIDIRNVKVEEER